MTRSSLLVHKSETCEVGHWLSKGPRQKDRASARSTHQVRSLGTKGCNSCPGRSFLSKDSEQA